MNLFSALSLVATLSGHFQATVDDIVQPNFRDASFTARVVKGNQAELAKVNKDFGNSYRFPSVDFRLKEPFKLRSSTKVEDSEVLFILNGTHRLIRVPQARIVSRENLERSPGKRQTTLDFGVLTPSLFHGLYQAKFIRVDRANGEYVFDLTFVPGLDDTSRSRVWVDPNKRYVTKREWYNQVGRQLATFHYENPKEQGGVWFPTRVSVINTDQVVAGVTQYESLRINQGLSDNLFNTN